MDEEIVTFAKNQFKDQKNWPGEELFKWQEDVRRLSMLFSNVEKGGGIPELLAISVLKNRLDGNPDVPQEFREKIKQITNVRAQVKSVLGWPWFEKNEWPDWIPEKKLKVTEVVPDRFTFLDNKLYLQVEYKIGEDHIDKTIFQRNKESSHLTLVNSNYGCLICEVDQEKIIDELNKEWLPKISLECEGCCRTFDHVYVPFRQVIVANITSDTLTKALTAVFEPFNCIKLAKSYHVTVYVDYRKPIISSELVGNYKF